MMKYLLSLFVAVALVGCNPHGKPPVTAKPDTDGGASKGTPLVFTAEEQEYIKTKKLKMGYSQAARPLAFKNDAGMPDGIGIAFARLVIERTGLQVEWIPFVNAGANIAAFRLNETDIVPNIVNVPERREFMAFTQPYLSVGTVMLLQQLPIKFPMEVGYVSKIDITSTLEKKGGQVKIVPFMTDEASFIALMQREIGGMVADELAVNYLENKYNTRFARASVDFIYDLGFGHHLDDPILGSILSKGVANLSSADRNAILAPPRSGT